MRWSFALLFFMGAMQAVIGWWMVYSGLQQKPAVSHYRLATHLLSALTLFAFTFWFALKLIFENNQESFYIHKKFRWLLFLFFIVLIIQIIFGAFTAGFVEGDAAKIRPGHIFNTWPKMGDEWVAEQVFMKGNSFKNFFENASGIQFVHRTLALLVAAMMCTIWYYSNKLKINKTATAGINILIYGVTLQFILGVLVLLYNVPVFTGALHQTGAFVLFADCIFLLFVVRAKE